MESISVKVNYNNKNIIIGKGVESEKRILEELQKRFSEVSKLKSKMRFEYEEGADSLEQAYKISQNKGKKSVKVKVIVDYVENCDMTMQIQLLEDDFRKEVQKEEEEINKAMQKLDSVQVVEVEEEKKPFMRKSSFEEIKSNRSQEKDNILEEVRKPSPAKSQKSQLSNKQSEISQRSSKLSSNGSNKSLKKVILEPEFVENTEGGNESLLSQNSSKKSGKKGSVIEESMSTAKPEVKEEKYENIFSPQAIRVINEIVESKTHDLTQKLDDLTVKYNQLLQIVQKPAQNPVPYKQAPKKQIIYKAEIIEKDHKEEVAVGTVVIPKFEVFNYGPSDWPEEVYVLQKSNGEMTELKGLKAGGKTIVELPEIKCINNGPKEMGQNYQFVYYDSKGDMIPFGRVFGIFFKVKESEGSKVFPSVFDMEFKEEPVRNSGISRKLMSDIIDQKKKKLKCQQKGNKMIVERLSMMGIDEKNFSEVDQEILEDIIRTVSE